VELTKQQSFPGIVCLRKGSSLSCRHLAIEMPASCIFAWFARFNSFNRGLNWIHIGGDMSRFV
jgi:hypothetical protein